MNSNHDEFTCPTRDGDEIPGYTTFLYDKNRFRKPEEYIGYETIRDASREVQSKYGLDSSTSVEEIVLRYARERQEVDACKAYINSLQADIKDLADKLASKTIAKETAEATVALYNTQIINQATILKTLYQELNKFGGHTAECQIAEFQACGRLVPQAANICTCGWTQVQEKIKEFVE